MTILESKDIPEIMKKHFPNQNNDFACDYVEELEELIYFGITTKMELDQLLEKHAEEVMDIDRSPMDSIHVKLYSDDFGKDFVENRNEHEFWFSYPALLRITLELEYKDKYIQFANKRDEI